MKLSEAIEGYWLDKKLDMSPTTIPGYEKTFARLVRFLDDAPFDAVTSDDIRRFLAWLPTEYPMGRGTVHDSWVPLSSLWTWAEKGTGDAAYHPRTHTGAQVHRAGHIAAERGTGSAHRGGGTTIA